MYATVDIGGTKTLVVIFDSHRNIIEQSKFPTPKQYSAFKTELETTVVKFTSKNFTIGCVGIRGNIDREAGLSVMDDIFSWGKVPIKQDCEQIFGCSFILENDSKLAGLAEARLVPDFRKVLYVTISTGIGSAFIVNGQLDPDMLNSEIGKGVYEHEGVVQQWEDFASGKAIRAKYGKTAGELDDTNAWHEISRNLAVGLIDAAAAYTPDIIIIGGGVGTHFSKFEKPLREAIGQMKPAEITFPEIRRAKHPEEAVIYGCFELAKDVYEKTS